MNRDRPSTKSTLLSSAWHTQHMAFIILRKRKLIFTISVIADNYNIKKLKTQRLSHWTATCKRHSKTANKQVYEQVNHCVQRLDCISKVFWISAKIIITAFKNTDKVENHSNTLILYRNITCYVCVCVCYVDANLICRIQRKSKLLGMLDTAMNSRTTYLISLRDNAHVCDLFSRYWGNLNDDLNSSSWTQFWARLSIFDINFTESFQTTDNCDNYFFYDIVLTT